MSATLAPRGQGHAAHPAEDETAVGWPSAQRAQRPLVKSLGLADYEPVWRRMQRFTDERTPATCDEIWFVEHPPVFTLGMNGDPSHVLDAGEIPVVKIDRGGQVTYHGPGQLVVYPLIDIRRQGLGVRELVVALENSVIDTVAEFGITAVGRRDAPGVYVDGQKLASVGLRIRRGASFHGMAINVSGDLSPFRRINVCGFKNLAVTRTANLGIGLGVEGFAARLTPHLLKRLGYG